MRPLNLWLRRVREHDGHAFELAGAVAIEFGKPEVLRVGHLDLRKHGMCINATLSHQKNWNYQSRFWRHLAKARL